MFEALSKYAEFSGRARRQEYWMFVLLYVISSIVAGLIDIFLGTEAVTIILGLALLIPSVAVLIRRLHDLDRTGWWALFMFLPILGTLLLLVFCVLKGTEGPNRYGPDPLARRDHEAANALKL